MKKGRFLAYIWLLVLCLYLLVVTGYGHEEPKYMALTFDDGPSGAITMELLEGLEQRGIKATFFLCGYRMELYPHVTGLLAEAGHEIGIHGYSHDSMGEMNRATLIRELKTTQSLLLEQTGKRAKLLRPPGGCCSPLLREVAQEQELSVVLWDIDPRDWEIHDAATIRDRIVAQAEDGAVILLHDLWKSSVEGALAAVDLLTEQGYRFVTVSQLQ